MNMVNNMYTIKENSTYQYEIKKDDIALLNNIDYEILEERMIKES